MLRKTLLSLVFVTAIGCVQNGNATTYSGTGHSFNLQDDPSVKILGPVTAVAGDFEDPDTHKTDWPLSITSPPPAATYQAAIREKAARMYGIAESSVVMDEIKVTYNAGIAGNVFGWSATATVGEKINR